MRQKAILQMPDFNKYRFTSIGAIEDSANCLSEAQVLENVRNDGNNDFAWARSILAVTPV